MNKTESRIDPMYSLLRNFIAEEFPKKLSFDVVKKANAGLRGKKPGVWKRQQRREFNAMFAMWLHKNGHQPLKVAKVMEVRFMRNFICNDLWFEGRPVCATFAHRQAFCQVCARKTKCKKHKERVYMRLKSSLESKAGY